jgi:SagB-type dehydrogenase family enzyme
MKKGPSFRGCRGFVLVALLVAGPATRAAEEPGPMGLPQPRLSGGKPLMEALRLRRSQREFSPRPLEPQLLSDLLWATFGINRPDDGHRTAPSAMNSQEVDVYVALADGLFLYDARAHRLEPVAAGDLRPLTGRQNFVKVAPVALVFVADLARMVKPKPEVKELYAWVDTGFVSQNTYLFCASAGLATVVHETGDRRALSRAMKLRAEQVIILAQSVGYPAP